jgi:hypothetical protein
MRKRVFILSLLGFLAIGLPMTAAALGLDLEAKAAAGIALGSTDNSSVTGAARMAAGGGVGVDLFLLTLGPIDLGLSTGVEYSYLTFHSVWSNFPFPGVDQTTDSTYNYINVPIALVGRVPIGSSLRLVVRAGAFIGYFLSGSANNTYSNPIVPSNTTTLNSDTTIQWNYGLHLTAGTDIALGGSLAIAPALQFDMGLADTSVNGPLAGDFKDTFWSLTLVVGIKYNVI